MKLSERKCAACEPGTPRLEAAFLRSIMAELPGWELNDDASRLHRRFRFADFRQAMAFVVKMALVAEQQDHHPDFTVHYRDVDVTLYTHTVGGLSDNDLIVAAKLGEL